MTQIHPTLVQTLVPRSSLLRDAALVIGGAALIALCAQIEIPLKPVPVTMQTFGVLLMGAALGWRRAALAALTYLAWGALGAPVFAGGSGGFAKIAGSTGGYLLSYALAAPLVGFLVERRGLDRSVGGTALVMLLGSAVIYLCGLPWLALTLHLSAAQAVAAGFTPFVAIDALKLVLAALVLPSAWALIRRR